MNPVLALVEPVAAEAHPALELLMRWAHVDQPWELGLVAFGVLAQGIFFGRWIAQWVASERRGESHVPESFWWLSIIGAALLLIYFVVRGEPVGVLGQTTGFLVYGRNLHLLRRSRAKEAAAGEALL